MRVKRPDGGYIFHGGCDGCETHQSQCHTCQMESANWDLPNLNTASAKMEAEDQAAKVRCRAMRQDNHTGSEGEDTLSALLDMVEMDIAN